MLTGFRGTFVIAWAQIEVDGQRAADPSEVRAGVAFSWSGEAQRVDGPPGLLELDDDASLADLRRRAVGRGSVRLCLGGGPLQPGIDQSDGGMLSDRGFVVSDGRRSWILTVISAGRAGSPLVMFAGDLPPRETELWVVKGLSDAAVLQPETTGGVVCFTPGTMILTETGPRPVESLVHGDRVQTKDNGPAEVIWIGQRRLTGARLHAMPHLAPVRLRGGALDKGVPDAGLLVSPDHRLVLRGARARDLFNADEVLVTARDLVNDGSITFDRSRREVTYIHLLLPQHEIVFANAVETESFHPDDAALASLDDGQLTDLLRHLPQALTAPMAYGPYSRRVLTSGEAAVLMHGRA